MKKSIGLLLLVTACVPATATTTVPVEGKNGLRKQTMTLTAKMIYGDDATLTAVSTSGETFQGKVIVPKTESSGFGGSSGGQYTTDRYGKPKVLTRDSAHSSYHTKYEANAHAILIGNKGHSMRCEFTLSHPSQGITMGAIGECEISGSGGIVPVSL